MTLFRRCLVLAALMFWQGGFTFYAAVVVPVGQGVLGSHLDQGFITRQVTNYLNLAGLVAVVPFFWDAAVAADPCRGRCRARWAAWLGMACLLPALSGLHQYLDHLLDPAGMEILDPGAFRTGHRWYLWLSTFQWFFSLVYAMLTLQAWKSADQKRGATEGWTSTEKGA